METIAEGVANLDFVDHDAGDGAYGLAQGDAATEDSWDALAKQNEDTNREHSGRARGRGFRRGRFGRGRYRGRGYRRPVQNEAAGEGAPTENGEKSQRGFRPRGRGRRMNKRGKPEKQADATAEHGNDEKFSELKQDYQQQEGETVAADNSNKEQDPNRPRRKKRFNKKRKEKKEVDGEHAEEAPAEGDAPVGEAPVAKPRGGRGRRFRGRGRGGFGENGEASGDVRGDGFPRRYFRGRGRGRGFRGRGRGGRGFSGGFVDNDQAGLNQEGVAEDSGHVNMHMAW